MAPADGRLDPPPVDDLLDGSVEVGRGVHQMIDARLEPGGAVDGRVLGPTTEIDRHQPVSVDERVGAIEYRRPAVGEAVATALAGLGPRDPVGEPLDHHGTQPTRVDRRLRDVGPAGEGLGPPVGPLQRSMIDLHVDEGMVDVEEQAEAVAEVRREIGRSAPEHVTILEQGRREASQPGVARVHDQTTEARMQRQPRHHPAALGRHPVSVECTEIDQQRHCASPRLLRWMVEERQLLRVADPTTGEVEHEIGHVHLGDLGGKVRHTAGVFGLRPESDRDSRSCPSGAARPLVRGRAGRGDGGQGGHPGAGVESRHAGESGIDHRADSLHGEARLREVGGQNDSLAGPGQQGGILFRRRQRSV